ncbi:hypothetical protein [Archangium violaceum]
MQLASLVPAPTHSCPSGQSPPLQKGWQDGVSKPARQAKPLGQLEGTSN